MVNKYLHLSYFLDKNTPLYGNAKGIDIIEDSSIEKGDSANTKLLTFPNHAGTHIDFPNHFFSDGKKSDDYPASFWIFENPFVLELNPQESELICLTHNQLNLIPKDTDFLILNTGFYRYRSQMKYWNNNPGISPEVAKQLKLQCPNIRVLGMDFISLTSYQHRAIGKVSHRQFLGEHDILLVEDMDLRKLKKQPKKIMCFPLMISASDGAPVNIIAKL
tara:strand:- start:373 stop:1029 length:657 start_codon:yes stop_codon:yes gene_type:complete